MSNHDFLIVSETFYSIQGEGASAGIPAVFLRLAGCNLRCNGFSYQHPETKSHLGCDTKHIWVRGIKRSFAEIIEDWCKKGWLNKLEMGAHLVVTGGEPTMHQFALVNFFKHLDAVTDSSIYIELETNGTILLSEDFLTRINQINVSPKLKNSGESREKAYHKDVLKQLSILGKVKFKFVVSQPEDVQEIFDEYINVFAINKKNIWLMPEGGTSAIINLKSQMIVELCKEHFLKYSPRLHVNIWEETTGV